MSESNKSYRIRADVQNEEYVDLNLNLVQDIDTFEILSLKISQDGLYKLHTSNYGCLVGRVLANNSVGVPNVNLSIFIEADSATTEDAILSYLYPYKSVSQKNEEGVRYNLLTEEKVSACHQNVGTFPVKRMVLDDYNVFEVYDKYYKFTTTTNKSGDYMMFGVPIGNQYLHMDLDISDIGDLLSQRPRDMVYKGYSSNLFDSANMFKKDNNLDTLTQIFTQDTTVYIHPFWGEPEEMGEADSEGVRITRRDINLNYKFEPTCVFMGSLVTDEKSNGFTKRCIPTERMGKMDRLTTGEGTIEMIRKKPDGSVEQFNILGNQLIDGNGTWCYQIPMNLDYVRSDEYGNIVPTDNPNIGIPTRTRVRFRISLNDFESDYQNNHLTKMLVPNNPKDEKEVSEMYSFGSLTPDDEEGTKGFRDLFWNNVYTVKSYIPRLQNHQFLSRDRRFSGVKAVNVNVGNNPIPYNNMRIDITFLFVLQCAILHMLIWIAGAVNSLIGLYGKMLSTCCDSNIEKLRCVTVGDGACPDLEDWYFAPNCPTTFARHTVLGKVVEWFLKLFGSGKDVNVLQNTLYSIEAREGVDDVKSIDAKNGDIHAVCITNKMDYFIQCIEIALAQEYEVIQFDFYNDWINGLVYIPRWFANVRKKRSYLFGLIRRKERLYACMEGVYTNQRKYVQQCALEYERPEGSTRYTKVTTSAGCGDSTRLRCHKRPGRKYAVVTSGFIHEETTLSGLHAYYFRPCDWDSSGKRINYFATDIVLLGSLTSTNLDGVPQTFKQLQSSSYQMPTNLAATNMAAMAYMYGTTDGTACSSSGSGNGEYLSDADIEEIIADLREYGDFSYLRGQKLTAYDVVSLFLPILIKQLNMYMIPQEEQSKFIDELTQEILRKYRVALAGGKVADVKAYDNTADGYQQWSMATGNEDHDYATPVEIAVTEASGIDWGYTGPGQEPANEEASNALYKPGGHFLGISCYSSESSIKSCVNLSRICELGSMISQMQYIPKEGSDDLDYTSFTVPTGLISGDEIEDGTFRNEFATLNHNGLKTRFDIATGRRVYDIYPMLPINYDGALGDIVDKIQAYNNLTGSKNGSYTMYKRTIEDASNDYYDFRLGLHEGENPLSRYAYEGGATVSMPIYENSFYFYFGLHDGSTALDRFFKEFYSECPEEDEDRFYITIEATGVDACTPGVLGTAKVYFIDVPLPVSYKVVDKDDNVVTTGTYEDISEPLVIENLEAGDYRLVVSSDTMDDVVKQFKIAITYPDDLGNIDIRVVNFSASLYYTDEEIQSGACKNESGAYVIIENIPNNVVSVVVDGGRHFCAYKGFDNQLDENELNPSWVMDGNKMYLWEGNTTYTIMAVYNCGDGVSFNVPPRMFTVTMPQELDLVIGGSTDVTYRKTLKRVFETVDNENWWKNALTNGGVTNAEKWYIERAITYRTPLGTSSLVDVVPKYGTVPYEYELTGNPESRGENVVEVLTFDPDLDPNTYRSFIIPTRNLPSVVDYGVLITGTTKTDYRMRVVDAENTAIPVVETYKFALPSVYKPFFFRGILYRNLTGSVEKDKYSLIAVNGTLYEGKYEYIDINETVHEENVESSTVAWWNLTGGDLSDFPCAKVSGETRNAIIKTGGLYTASVKENAPQGAFTTPTTFSDTVRFPGDKGTVTPNIRYFKMYRSLLSGSRAPASGRAYSELFTSLNFLPWRGDGLVEDGKNQNYYCDGTNVYWNGSVTNAFTLPTGDGGYFIFSPTNELNKAKILSGDVSEITEVDNDCYIVAVYDPWTRLTDEQFKSAQKGRVNNGYGMAFKYENVAPDANMFTIVTVYPAVGFKKIVNGGSQYSYDDNKIIIDPHEHEIELDYNVQSANQYTMEYESDAFTLSEGCVLYVSPITFRVNSDVYAHYDFTVYVKRVIDSMENATVVYERGEQHKKNNLEFITDAWEASARQLMGPGSYKIYVVVNFGSDETINPGFIGDIYVWVSKITAEVKCGNIVVSTEPKPSPGGGGGGEEGDGGGGEGPDDPGGDDSGGEDGHDDEDHEESYLTRSYYDAYTPTEYAVSAGTSTYVPPASQKVIKDDTPYRVPDPSGSGQWIDPVQTGEIVRRIVWRNGETPGLNGGSLMAIKRTEGYAVTGDSGDVLKYYENGVLKRLPNDDISIEIRDNSGRTISYTQYKAPDEYKGPDWLFFHQFTNYNFEWPGFGWHTDDSCEYFLRVYIPGQRKATASMRPDNLKILYCGHQLPVMDYDYYRDVLVTENQAGDVRVLEDRELYNEYSVHIFYNPGFYASKCKQAPLPENELAVRKFRVQKTSKTKDETGKTARLFLKFVEDDMAVSLRYRKGGTVTVGGGIKHMYKDQPVFYGVYDVGQEIELFVGLCWKDEEGNQYPTDTQQIVVTEDKICYTIGYSKPHRPRDGAEPVDDDVINIDVLGELYDEDGTEPTGDETETTYIDAYGEVTELEPSEIDVVGNVTTEEPTEIDVTGSVTEVAPTELDVNGTVSANEPVEIDVNGSVSSDEPVEIDVNGSISSDAPVEIDVNGNVTNNN